MNQDTIKDMALAVLRGLRGPLAARENLPVDHENILHALEGYWSDKIAHVWTADDLIGEAVENGYPMTREHAASLLKSAWENLGSDEQGITWETLRIAIEDDEDFNLANYTEPGKAGQVLGVFWVRLENDGEHYYDKFFGSDGDLVSLRFEVEGNFAPALEYARKLALENAGERIYLASLDITGVPSCGLIAYAPVNAPDKVIIEKDVAPDFHQPSDDGDLVECENTARAGDDDEWPF